MLNQLEQLNQLEPVSREFYLEIYVNIGITSYG